jgi:hypothetical protein
MAFDAKELMIDITKAGTAQLACQPTFHQCQPTFGCHPTYCLCTYQITFHCLTGTIVPCQFGTYTCFGSILTCGGTIYCAGSNDPTILYQGIDRETVVKLKEQLKKAQDELALQEKRLADAGKKT